MTKTRREILICDCHSLEHQLSFWYDKDEKILYCEPHLTTYRKFFSRLWYGLKYAFGHKSNYGAWDQVLIKPKELQLILKNLMNE